MKRSIVNALCRRFERERDEPWHADAHAIAVALLRLVDTGERSRALYRPLVVAAGRLPARESGATSLRSAAIGCALSASADAPPPLAAGDWVTEAYGDVSLIVARAAPPTAAWLAVQ